MILVLLVDPLPSVPLFFPEKVFLSNYWHPLIIVSFFLVFSALPLPAM